jgi:hypothetical protein
MTKHNPENERIKRKYLGYLKEAKLRSEQTVDAAAKALSRFEEYTRHRDFKTFHFEQAVAFKRHFSEQSAQRSREKVSNATLHATLTQMSQFFFWLARQPGYKARLQYSDADYFNLSEKDTRAATAQRERKAPTLEQVQRVIETMPSGSEIERWNLALVAFTLLTGARAVASMKLKHVELREGCVQQDAREVKTKFSKTFTTYFAPVTELIRKVGIGEQTFYRWKKQHVGLESEQVREMRQLQDENSRLNQLEADLRLDKTMLQDVPQTLQPRACTHPRRAGRIRLLTKSCAQWRRGCHGYR